MILFYFWPTVCERVTYVDIPSNASVTEHERMLERVLLCFAENLKAGLPIG